MTTRRCSSSMQLLWAVWLRLLRQRPRRLFGTTRACTVPPPPRPPLRPLALSARICTPRSGCPDVPTAVIGSLDPFSTQGCAAQQLSFAARPLRARPPAPQIPRLASLQRPSPLLLLIAVAPPRHPTRYANLVYISEIYEHHPTPS
ncbi:hypothetical protein D9611_013165 [Ephemerocybe angulata]|uniref:Uncharacterized protein n=1 Tax=Ephemerocybe angulata TaxID=980116 RepID=A0A8H5FA73_9AGAR|nr:hypothetical protein D9611_013165 [Tulosesus angulatus]